MGITSVQNPGGTAEELELYADARRAGDLALRVVSALALDGNHGRRPGSERWTPSRPAVSGRSAVQDRRGQDHARRRNRHAQRGDARTVRDRRVSWRAGDRCLTISIVWSGCSTRAAGRCSIHAAGDRAVRMALNAFEHAVRSNPRPERGRRHRIEQAGIVDAVGSAALRRARRDRVDAAAAADTRASGWPGRAARSARRRARGAGWPSQHRRRGRHGSRSAATGRARRSIRWSGLQAAVTRTDAGRLPEGGWVPGTAGAEARDRRVDVGRRLGVVRRAAQGHARAGMLADLVVLSRTSSPAPPSRLPPRAWSMTIFDGRSSTVATVRYELTP